MNAVAALSDYKSLWKIIHTGRSFKADSGVARAESSGSATRGASLSPSGRCTRPARRSPPRSGPPRPAARSERARRHRGDKGRHAENSQDVAVAGEARRHRPSVRSAAATGSSQSWTRIRSPAAQAVKPTGTRTTALGFQVGHLRGAGVTVMDANTQYSRRIHVDDRTYAGAMGTCTVNRAYVFACGAAAGMADVAVTRRHSAVRWCSRWRQTVRCPSATPSASGCRACPGPG